MGLFSKCVVCGKKKLSVFVDRGVCTECYKQMMEQEQDQEEEKFDVSSFVKQADSDYTPPPASSDEPVYVFIDVETTGLSPTKDAIIQVSALRFFGQKSIDGLNSYINPQRPIPKESTEIHGINDEKVKDAPIIDEIKEPFLNLIKDAILVGYNTPFDLDFLDCAFHGDLNNVKYIDVLEIAKTLIKLPNYHLETVADYAEFHPEGGYHDSLTDCTATAAIFFRLSFDKPGLAKIYHSKKFAKADYSFSPKDVVPSAIPVDTTHPLYDKKIVFTGELSIGRREAAQMAVDVGAIVRSSVSSKTDYLVVGKQDITIVGDDGMSGKEEKAYQLNEAGKAFIKIISEQDFLLLVQGNTTKIS